MSSLSPCANLSCAPHGRMFAAPLAGALLALVIVASSSLAMPLLKAENTHFPPERLAEIERMMAAD